MNTRLFKILEIIHNSILFGGDDIIEGFELITQVLSISCDGCKQLNVSSFPYTEIYFYG